MTFLERKRRSESKRGERNGRATVTWEIVRTAREIYKADRYSIAYMADLYDVSYSTMYDVLTGKTWKEAKK